MAARIVFSQNQKYFVFVILHFVGCGQVEAAYNIQAQSPTDCLVQSAGFNQYYDITQLKCLSCAQASAFQVTSPDGLSCVCAVGYYLTSNYGGAIQCAPCPAGQIASFSGWECVVPNCATTTNSSVPLPPSNQNTSSPCVCNVQNNEIYLERQITGIWPSQPPSRQCTTCAPFTKPDYSGKQCVRCNQVLSMVQNAQCNCPSTQMAGGLCFTRPTDINAAVQQLFKVTFGSLTLNSDYLTRYAQAAAASCGNGYQNITACELLGNLCSLTVYTEGSNVAPSVCTLYRQLVTSAAGSNTSLPNWPPGLPWLYYLSGDKPSTILTDTSIPTVFTFPNSSLNFILSSYSINGSFIGFVSPQNGVLQLCSNTISYLNAAWTFGTVYQQGCNIPVQSFWNTQKYPLVFYDMWLQYQLNGVTQNYAIPVLITNYVDANGNSPNSNPGVQSDSWILVRRFFLIDNISGRQTSTTGGPVASASAIRFASSFKIHMQLQPSQNGGGLIYPPWVEITYGVATSDDYNSNNIAQITFQVVYDMDDSSIRLGISIAVGVLGGVAFIYTVLETWGWQRRQGQLAIDLLTLFKFVLFGCGNAANALFAVIFFSSLWWLIFYKNQTTANLMINDGTAAYFIGFLIAAFALKAVQLLHILISQMLVDIFLIDWEKPPARSNTSTTHHKGQPTSDVAPSVSVWRTYFVANEWNEIQSMRKISPVFQYFLTIFFLSVVGIGNLGTMDPQSTLTLGNLDHYYAPVSNILRFPLLASVYIIIAVLQWLFFALVYERFFEDKIHQFTDLCSTSNISLFILENQHFGYYIHGRSVHGRTDISLKEMHHCFVKEKMDLCGKRGLVSNTEQQTFQIAVTSKLRNMYNKVISPLLLNRPQAGKDKTLQGGARLDSFTEQSIEAHHELTHNLQLYIDHALHDVDYVVKSKSLLEFLLNIEFQTPTDKGFFYPDGGRSFADVLVYGHEKTFIIFEILLIGVIDLIAHNYFLDVAITYFIVMIILDSLRDSVGRNNLAKKTLVDKRFLI